MFADNPDSPTKVKVIQMQRQIEILRKEIREIKDAEIKRILKEFNSQNYAYLHNTNLTIVSNALFGMDLGSGKDALFQGKIVGKLYKNTIPMTFTLSN